MKIPVVERQIAVKPTLLTAPKQPGVVRAAFGEDTARAMSELGDTALKAGLDIKARRDKQEAESYEVEFKAQEALQKHKLERKLQAEESDAALREANFRQEVQDTLLSPEPETVTVNGVDIERPRGIMNRTLDNSAGSTLEFHNKYKDLRKKYLTGIDNPDIAQKLSERLDGLFLGYRDNVISHEANQGRASMTAKNEALLKLQKADAVRYDTPEKLNLGILHSVTTQNRIDNINGVDDKTKQLNNIVIASDIALLSTSSVLTNTGSLEDAIKLLDAEVTMNGVKTSVKKAIGKGMYEDITAKLRKQDVSQKRTAKFVAGLQEGTPQDNFMQYSYYMDLLSTISRSIDSGADVMKVRKAVSNIRMDIATDKGLSIKDKKSLIFGNKIGGYLNMQAVIEGQFKPGTANKIGFWDNFWDGFAKGATNKKNRVEAWNRFLDSVSDDDPKDIIRKKAEKALIETTMPSNISIGKDPKIITDGNGTKLKIWMDDDGYYDKEFIDDEGEEPADVGE